MPFRKLVFLTGYLVLRPAVLFNYAKLMRNKRRTFSSLRQEQLKAVRKYLIFCRDKFPVLRDELSGIDLAADSFAFDSMTRLSVQDKNDVKRAIADWDPVEQNIGKFKRGQTGGSTGSPLKYFISEKCSSMGQAILYRGWSYGGYRLGDKMAVMAGGSLIGKKLSRRARMIAYVQNIRKYSSYGVSEATFQAYFADMKKWRPKFLRGYVSSIYEFARFLERNELTLSFDAVFTTAEMLHPFQRSYIEAILSTKVFNNYGLNDGSVTAFECSRHRGLHVDLERGYLEVHSTDGKRSGAVLATAFLNTATPFVRYDTGDIAELTDRSCDCGLPFPLLESLCGRETDALEINGRIIGSPVLTVLMSGIDVSRYQFIQDGPCALSVIIDKGATYSFVDEEFIRSSLFSQVGHFDISFSYDTENFRQVNGAKHMLVIRDA